MTTKRFIQGTTEWKINMETEREDSYCLTEEGRKSSGREVQVEFMVQKIFWKTKDKMKRPKGIVLNTENMFNITNKHLTIRTIRFLNRKKDKGHWIFSETWYYETRTNLLKKSQYLCSFP